MKVIRKIAKFSFIALAIMMFASCNKTTEETTTAPAAAESGTPAPAVIRYIDGDTLMAKYNLAIDINEAMLRRSNQLDNEQMKRGNEIQRLGNEIQNKYKNNGYLTEESFNADQNRLAKMQNDAQTYLAKLQRDAQNEMMQYQIQLNDSVQNFIKAYAKEKGYDVILYKASAVFIDPKYDVTGDVIEGLNKRYTKVEKK
ncbi:MAG: OmpH family outer membrane protein [Bacteroidales bacterium]|nr:OmpH family outer membrane protein [Bacteroidales bacterium]